MGNFSKHFLYKLHFMAAEDSLYKVWHEIHNYKLMLGCEQCLTRYGKVSTGGALE